jgi:DNA (cytosine-5)-methyltransferase 1
VLTIGSLFSGIGGLELGLEWSGLGPVLWQVESDDYCRRVLEKHWPGTARFADVRTVGTAQLEPVDIICGGFPCQDISSAGPGTGLAGKRSGLWSEFARVAAALRPRWCVVENSGGAGSRWVDAVARDLEQLGYETLPCPLSAWAVGASHTRVRVFLLAYADRDGKFAKSEHAEVARAPRVRPDAAQERFEERVSSKGDGATGHKGEGSEGGGAFSWGFEPDLVRAVHGVPNRVDRVAALGNAVVPQCAQVVGEVIRALELAGDYNAASTEED